MLRQHYTALADAAGRSASPQIRHVATLGGNLLQRPRCWYFRSAAHHCSRKGGDHCFAFTGENQYHAIFGQMGCAIVHPSTAATALLAFDARVELLSAANGTRIVPMSSFLVGPEVDITRETDLHAGEVLTAVLLPSVPAHHAVGLPEAGPAIVRLVDRRRRCRAGPHGGRSMPARLRRARCRRAGAVARIASRGGTCRQGHRPDRRRGRRAGRGRQGHAAWAQWLQAASAGDAGIPSRAARRRRCGAGGRPVELLLYPTGKCWSTQARTCAICCSPMVGGRPGAISSKCRCSSRSNPVARRICVSCRTSTRTPSSRLHQDRQRRTGDRDQNRLLAGQQSTHDPVVGDIGKPARKHPVDVTLHHRGHRHPPQRIDQCHHIRHADIILGVRHVGTDRIIGDQFFRGQNGVEIPPVQIESPLMVSVSFQFGGISSGQTHRKAVFGWMGDDNEMIHRTSTRVAEVQRYGRCPDHRIDLAQARRASCVLSAE